MKDIKYLKRLESNRRYKKRNPEKVKEYKKRYYLKHKDSIKKQKKEYALKNPEKALRWKLNPYYRQYKNFSLQKYNEFLQKQNNVCAICEKPENGKRLAVDHCHLTDEVRGLLCQKCNRGIGIFNDDIILLTKAKNYLQNQAGNYNEFEK